MQEVIEPGVGAIVLRHRVDRVRQWQSLFRKKDTMQYLLRSWVRGVSIALLGVLAGAGSGAWAQGEKIKPQGAEPSSDFPITQAWKDFKMLRVCGDPENMPFSDRQKQGFENKIADVLASALGDSVVYTWWPHRRGFVRNTLGASECDVVMGVPAGYDPVLTTSPYYRSTYYIVTRADRHLNIRSLDDPRLKSLKVGVGLIGDDYTNTPPAQALGSHGVTQNVRGFSLFYDEDTHPQDIVNAVANGTIDVALVWGPVAGYFANASSVPLSLTALPDSDSASGVRFAYDVAIGVRHSDREFKATLDSLLTEKRDTIQGILRAYHVPTLELKP
ncbi:MAG TPA: substrate-binding domain-containing protein [Gemmatimonadaceae bacterium]|nr:substrate-binding domain-containing protein [Gemmatimonadaceae bacterium]